MFESISASAVVVVMALWNFAVLLGILGIGRFAYLWTNPNSSKEISERKNSAMAVAFGGYIVGLGIAASGAILSPGPASFWGRTAFIAAAGIASIILMRLSLVINNRLILSKFDNLEEIERDHNMGVAFVEVGGCLATGFIIYAVMTSQSMSMTDKLIDGLVYWSIGQALLVLGMRIFDKTIPYDPHAELQNNNNPAVGLVYGGFLLSLGLVLMTAINGATSNIIDELGTIAVFYSIGIALLLAARYAVNFILTSKTRPMDEFNNQNEIGFASLELASLLVIAILFVSSLAPANTAAMFARPSAPQIVISSAAGSDKE